METETILKLLLISWVIIVIIKVVFEFILIPSYSSTILKCYDGNLTLDERAEEMNVVVVGTYEPCNNSITVLKSTRQTVVERYEECHRQQFLEGRLAQCPDKYSIFWNEVECNIQSYFN